MGIGVRIVHWALVLFYTIAYISEDIEVVHVYAGYVVLGLIFFRVLVDQLNPLPIAVIDETQINY
ncbi:MAG: hypothetical protein WBM41_11295 [Arenicellales bacterium]